jgi:hypothetical protein
MLAGDAAPKLHLQGLHSQFAKAQVYFANAQVYFANAQVYFANAQVYFVSAQDYFAIHPSSQGLLFFYFINHFLYLIIRLY